MERDSQTISDIMRNIKSRDTGPEIRFRKALWKYGIRYHLYSNDLPGKPDIVLPNKQIAIFIDGDFWHGNQWKKRDLASLEEQFPNHKQAYWPEKIHRNMERDISNTDRLLKEGWRVLRFWTSDIEQDLDTCIGVTLAAITNKDARSAYDGVIAERSVAEFFAGVGLMRLGLNRKGWEIRFANDIAPEKYEMYKHNFADTTELYRVEDIHKLSGDDIPIVTLATASFPCNDLSLAGSYKGLAGKHSSTIWELMRILNEMGDRRPHIVMLENVPSFISSNNGQDFHNVLLALNELGYSCDAFILNAANFVPQSRARIFVLAIQEQIDENRKSRTAEVPLFYESEVRPKKLTEFISAHPEVNWRIEKLPAPPSCDSNFTSILEDIPHDSPIWWSKERTEYLRNQMSEKHGIIANYMSHRDYYSYGTVFRRVRKGRSMAELRVDGIAGCLRTPRGGSGRQILFKAGKGQYWTRFLTPRECARLQGAPDTYKIETPLNQALFAFGDAVCVPVIEWIAEYYLNPLINSLLRGRLLFKASD
jgi:DNA (cytosine-5)-methyltransferase 1